MNFPAVVTPRDIGTTRMVSISPVIIRERILTVNCCEWMLEVKELK